MIKKILIVVLIVILLGFALLISKDVWMRSAVIVATRTMLGAPVEVDRFSLGIFKPSVHLKGLRIYNPPGFTREVFIDIPEVKVTYDLGALLKGKLHLPLVVMDMKQLVVEKDKEGQLNVDSLKVVKDQQKKSKEPKKEEKVEKAKKEEMPMQIDELKLNIGRVISKEIGKDGKEKVQVFDVGVRDKTYKNITSANQLAILILSESMGPTTIKGAAVYGLATVAGIGLLPIGAAVVLTGKDSAEEDLSSSYDKVFAASLEVIRTMGELVEQDKNKGTIKAKVDGGSALIKISKSNDGKTHVIITARKMMMPNLKTAEGILYKLNQRLQ